MIKYILFYALLMVMVVCGQPRVFLSPKIDPLSDLMINKINSLNTTWKAGKNFHGLTINQIKRLCGVKKSKKANKILERVQVPIEANIPEQFDSRQAWPDCPSISFIRDQGSCGSCWAFSSAEAMSDRTCIGSNGTLKVELSAEDVLSCCTHCGYGCDGGFPVAAYDYWVTNGLVTGGLYNGTGCQPYKIEPCEHAVLGPRPACSEATTPACEVTCQPGYPKSYLSDKYFGMKRYTFEHNVAQIQSDIMRNGPVTAVFEVYSDFIVYKSGVYQRHSKDQMGAHAIRILGWGVENKVPYWLVANSWNTDWGDNGYFKIRRGNNECGIENSIVTGLPKINA